MAFRRFVARRMSRRLVVDFITSYCCDNADVLSTSDAGDLGASGELSEPFQLCEESSFPSNRLDKSMEPGPSLPLFLFGSPFPDIDKKLFTASSESFLIVSGAVLSLCFTCVDLYECCSDEGSSLTGASFESFVRELDIDEVFDNVFTGSFRLSEIHHSPIVGMRDACASSASFFPGLFKDSFSFARPSN